MDGSTVSAVGFSKECADSQSSHWAVAVIDLPDAADRSKLLPCGSPSLPQMPTSIIVALGMTGYFTGVTQTPWTGAIIVMEMIDDHSLILPMLAPTFIALGVSRLACKEPVYAPCPKRFCGCRRPPIWKRWPLLQQWNRRLKCRA